MAKTEDLNPKTKDIGAILLAAGQSRRMGAFKPLLPFGGKTVIEACVDYLHEGGIQNIIVVVGSRADEIREKLGSSSISFVVNPDPASEMSLSIACGVVQLPAVARAAVIALVDQPAIPASVITTLATEWEEGARLVVPTFAGRGGHPVLIDLQLREELMNLDPASGLKTLFESHRDEVRRVSVASPYIARDMDTWDDYRALYEDVFGVQPPQFGSKPS
jgi:CTP:molybdopterin cytidylyltransferase MocA